MKSNPSFQNNNNKLYINIYRYISEMYIYIYVYIQVYIFLYCRKYGNLFLKWKHMEIYRRYIEKYGNME